MSLNNQPYEILLMIFNHLDDKDILSISLLNPYYQQIGNEIAKIRLMKKEVKLTDNTNYAKMLTVKINLSNVYVAIVKDDVETVQYLMNNDVIIVFNDIYLHILKFNAIKILRMFLLNDVKINITNRHNYYYILSFSTVELFQLVVERFPTSVNLYDVLERSIEEDNYELSYYISSRLVVNINYEYRNIMKLAYHKPTNQRYLNIIIILYSNVYNITTISSLISHGDTDVAEFIVGLPMRNMSHTDLMMKIIESHNCRYAIIKFFIDNYDDIDKTRPLKYFINKKYFSHEYIDIYKLLLDDSTVHAITRENIFAICTLLQYDNNLFKLLVKKGVDVRFDDDAVFNGLLSDSSKYYVCRFLLDSNIGITADVVTAFTVETVMMKANINHMQFLIDIGVDIGYS